MLFRLQKILLWPALIGLSAASCWGIYSAHLLAPPLWAPMGLRRLDFARHLVGLDLDDRLALDDAVAGRLDPAQDLAGLLRHLQRRHDDVRWHRARGFYRSSRP